MIRLIVFLCILSLTAGCANIPTPSQRLLTADQLAVEKNWGRISIEAEQFDFVSFIPDTILSKKILTIYIEGDGLAWLNQTTPSADPTPIYPLGLLLALKHTNGNAAYLARPCQFTGGVHTKNCGSSYWTNKRFSVEVIESSNVAINNLKQIFGAEKLQLIGYSGGGAIAALVAAGRNDVARLITIAGNLDHESWVVKHHISHLTGSLNPKEYWRQLQHIPQIHFVGEYDDVVSFEIVDAYRSRFIDGIKPKIVVIPKFDHRCCWVDRWPSLLTDYL